MAVFRRVLKRVVLVLKRGLAHRRDLGVGQVRPMPMSSQTHAGPGCLRCSGSSRLRCRGSQPLRPLVDDLG
jgi:hypothetical protein